VSSDNIKVASPVCGPIGNVMECPNCHSWHVQHDDEEVGWKCSLCGHGWGGIETWPSVEVKVDLDPIFHISIVANGKLMSELTKETTVPSFCEFVVSEDYKTIRFRPDALLDGMILVAGYYFGRVFGGWKVFKLRDAITIEEIPKEVADEAAKRDYQ